MGEIVDELALQPVELPGFLVVDEDGEDPQQDDPHQHGEHHDDDPGLGGQHLGRIHVDAAGQGLQAAADLDVPVDEQEQGQRQGNN